MSEPKAVAQAIIANVEKVIVGKHDTIELAIVSLLCQGHLLIEGVEPYLVAAALRLAVAQRLLRRLCRHCRIPRPLTEWEAISLNRPDLTGDTIHDPSGCIYCNGKGYFGRIGLYEILELNEDWARGVADGEGEGELVMKMRASGVRSLIDDAVHSTLVTLNIPSRKEVSELTRKVDELSRKIDGLKTAARPKARRVGARTSGAAAPPQM